MFTSKDLMNLLGLQLGDKIIVDQVRATIVYNEIGGYLLKGQTENGYTFSQRITYLIDREYTKC